MRIAVLGAGAMGSAAAKLLGRREDVELLVMDTDRRRVDAVVGDLPRASAATVGPEGPVEHLRSVDAVASCVPYRLNLQVMEAALEASCPYVDLGGLYHMTLRQLELDGRFRERGVPAILGVGCCPGLSNVLARMAANRLDSVESIDLVDGAQEESESFGVPYSADTILDEFAEPAVVFEGGELRTVSPGSGAVRWPFPEPLGEMEAVYTLHSELATLPRTIPGVRDVRWRLALPPAVADGFKLLVDLGLARDDPVETSSGPVSPREVLRALLARMPAPEGPPRDVEILLVRTKGVRGGSTATFTAEARFEPQPEGISAGAFGTAIPIAVAARWLADGRIPPGAHAPEDVLDPDPFVEELVREGVKFRVSWEGD